MTGRNKAKREPVRYVRGIFAIADFRLSIVD